MIRLSPIIGIPETKKASAAPSERRPAPPPLDHEEGAEHAAQVGEVLKRQGVDLIVIDLVGYDIHIDGSFQMVDRDLALVDPFGLPYSFLEKLKELKVRTIEITPADNKWIINSLAVAPGTA